VNYEWDFGDGDISHGSTKSICSHVYSSSGPFEVNLTVTDNEGDRNTKTIEINVTEPLPEAVGTYSPPNPKVDDVITFNAAQSSDKRGRITEYEWDFDDGYSGKRASIKHQYLENGTYNVKLTVINDKGMQNISMITVVVKPKEISTLTSAEIAQGRSGSLVVPINPIESFSQPTNPNALPGDDILDWRIESIKDDGAIFQVYQSINPTHGCAQYQTGCDYFDYVWLGGTFLKGGMPINTGHSSGTQPGQEFQPEKFQPYIQGWNRVEITVYGNGTGPITSDEVEFNLYGGRNNAVGAFFTKRFPYVHTWNPRILENVTRALNPSPMRSEPIGLTMGQAYPSQNITRALNPSPMRSEPIGLTMEQAYPSQASAA
jgi:PKD repeat protein